MKRNKKLIEMYIKKQIDEGEVYTHETTFINNGKVYWSEWVSQRNHYYIALFCRLSSQDSFYIFLP